MTRHIVDHPEMRRRQEAAQRRAEAEAAEQLESWKAVHCVLLEQLDRFGIDAEALYACIRDACR